MTYSKIGSNEVSITIDGKQLSHAGTGLALVTSELLQAFHDLGYAQSIIVFIEESCDLTIYNLDKTDFQWIRLKLKPIKVDYIYRLAWARSILKELQYLRTPYKHFIPYLYNYGNTQENIVLIPDLVYKIFPDYGIQVTNKPWWNLRGKLPIRHLFRRWEEQQSISANQIIVYSEFVRHHIQQELHVLSNKITVVPLATPSWVTSQYDESRNQILEKTLCLPPSFAMYVGGFANRKNIPMLLRVCGKIYVQDSSFRCAFVGLTEANINNDPEISEAMQDSSIQQATILLPKLSYPDLASLYRLAEFTVYPSISEGFGLPILEAATAKKLCLCGDNSSMQEIQTNPQYRIDTSNELAWMQKILHFWQNPEIGKQAGEVCEQLCQKYSWRKSAQQLWKIMQS
jgi:glycosyltransferase involved in cell wall biosynthesis